MNATNVSLCRLSDLDDAAARRFDVGEHRICVVRIGDRVRAIADTCSHADVSLAEGVLDVDECAIECWKHGSLFSLDTGEPLTLPAIRGVAVYAVAVVDGDVTIELPGESHG